MENEIKAKEIVLAILHDITGRSGIGNEYEQIDEEIQQEIFETWVKIVIDKL